MNSSSNRYIDGRKKEALYFVFHAMHDRCENPTNKDYPDYGGRGIEVWNGWADYDVFRYWAYTNGYKPGLTLERVDNAFEYSPINCKWVTRLRQANNRRVRKGTDPDSIGVHFRDGSWQATHSVYGKQTHIRCYQTKEEAQSARRIAEEKKLAIYSQAEQQNLPRL